MFIPSPFFPPLSLHNFFFMHCNAGDGFKLQILWTNVSWVDMKLRRFTLLVGEWGKDEKLFYRNENNSNCNLNCTTEGDKISFFLLF